MLIHQGEGMKYLKKNFIIVILSFTPLYLWAVENEKLDCKEAILSLYESKIKICEKFVDQEFNISRTKISEVFSDEDIKRDLKEASKLSGKLINFVLEIDVSELRELFKEAWTN